MKSTARSKLLRRNLLLLLLYKFLHLEAQQKLLK